jgi:activator of HSP90 ATPase
MASFLRFHIIKTHRYHFICILNFYISIKIKHTSMIRIMADSLEISDIIPATPKEIYTAWLDSKKHSAMTGSPAEIDPIIGGKFSAWEEYIEGTIVELEPNHRIVQKWRTTDFPDDLPDSDLEILLDEVPGGTKVTIVQSSLPEDQVDAYKLGWKDFYFEPMKAYFKKRKVAGKKTKK